jgi:YD repeat-containing protein
VFDAQGNETDYTTSDRDLQTAEVSPVSGTTIRAYNQHGQLVSTTDARGITVGRQLDALDRVTFVDYPETVLDTLYVYDDVGICPATTFPLGRLSTIAKNATFVDYCYDRFGRATGAQP